MTRERERTGVWMGELQNSHPFNNFLLTRNLTEIKNIRLVILPLGGAFEINIYLP